MNPLFFCHRINKISDLNDVNKKYGIEIDLRDKDNDIILCHDPFEDGEKFEDFLKVYDKSYIILNIKSETIEFKVIDLLKKYDIKKYFFLDCSFPMIYNLNKANEKNIAIRFSEYESIETVLNVKDMVKWVWVDCFNKFPLTKNAYDIFKLNNLKICLVSPELQGYSSEKISEFREIVENNNFEIDGICTKYYNIGKW